MTIQVHCTCVHQVKGIVSQDGVSTETHWGVSLGLNNPPHICFILGKSNAKNVMLQTGDFRY
jgi:hypothetical protein